MTRLYALGSHFLGSLGLASLALGLIVAAQSLAYADCCFGVNGDCKTTAVNCGPGTCTSAAQDCTATTCNCR